MLSPDTPPVGRAARCRAAVAATRALAAHPSLWPVALRTARRLVPPRWWARRPHLPVPDADYLRFRIETAYGGRGDALIEPEDLLTYLRWCRHPD